MSRWIKVAVTTPDKWQVVTAAEMCHASAGDAFLAFFRVFAWLDELTEDGRCRGVTRQRVDAVAMLPGFASAMERVGWMTFDAGGMTVTNWGEHNGQCAKRRALNARRMSRNREQAGAKSTLPWPRDDVHI